MSTTDESGNRGDIVGFLVLLLEELLQNDHALLRVQTGKPELERSLKDLKLALMGFQLGEDREACAFFSWRNNFNARMTKQLLEELFAEQAALETRAVREKAGKLLKRALGGAEQVAITTRGRNVVFRKKYFSSADTRAQEQIAKITGGLLGEAADAEQELTASVKDDRDELELELERISFASSIRALIEREIQRSREFHTLSELVIGRRSKVVHLTRQLEQANENQISAPHNPLLEEELRLLEQRAQFEHAEKRTDDEELQLFAQRAQLTDAISRFGDREERLPNIEAEVAKQEQGLAVQLAEAVIKRYLPKVRPPRVKITLYGRRSDRIKIQREKASAQRSRRRPSR